MTVEYGPLARAVLALLAAAGIALWTHLRSRRMLDTLDRMLDDAIRGDFQESLYDESRLSALETRMAHYLSSNTVSARNLAAEKDAIKTLIGDISHQTKTPIANLLLYAQLLAEQDLPPESRAYVSALEGQAEKLRFLIDALVKTSRLESGILAMTPVVNPLQSLLDGAAAQAAPRAEARGIALTVEPTDLSARFDPKWTTEALYNLVDNAVKYTPTGGSVTLRAVGYELFCRIDITDTGPGIPEAEQAKIFQRFYRSPSVSGEEGVGIGLYLARQIAAGQGGYLKVTSRPGEGSTFSLFLPRVE
ncbi:HAMP domain-containing histidine kinase [Oscillibacter valericigenes]|uniref:histidine kinase n=1 Tax=Oscillibacter valericigenes TaxID=351091 RepID=A0ABS2FZ51_9FIRM|nr:HAMP domain-containing sensor histidine kinase [Oscillibacter valericigenes]MBM6852341.1 HAMP domain-containing histidine kinase [Oscillibacter valericigenes]